MLVTYDWVSTLANCAMVAVVTVTLIGMLMEDITNQSQEDLVCECNDVCYDTGDVIVSEQCPVHME